MRRRDFITLISGAALAEPRVARAQERVRRIGVLMGQPANDTEPQARLGAVREGLQALGWVEGRNLQIDIRWTAPGDAETTDRFAKELVALGPELILSQNTLTTAALLRQTRTISLIFFQVTDPLGSGFVASMPRPGG